jgi:hypothetical protein
MTLKRFSRGRGTAKQLAGSTILLLLLSVALTASAESSTMRAARSPGSG